MNFSLWRVFTIYFVPLIFLLLGTYFYLLLPYTVLNILYNEIVKKKILKLHKYPFVVVLIIWGKQFKEKALHHVEGEKMMVISIQDQDVVLCIQGNTY